MRAIIHRDPPSGRVQIWFRTATHVLARKTNGELHHLPLGEAGVTSTQDLPVYEIPDDQWDAILAELVDDTAEEVLPVVQAHLADAVDVRDRLLAIVERSSIP